MFSFIASFIGVVWLMEHWVEVLIVFVLLIACILIVHHNRKKRREAYLALPVLYVGNKSTHVYHLPSCKYVAGLAPFNTVLFRTQDEVVRSGYSRCNVCKP